MGRLFGCLVVVTFLLSQATATVLAEPIRFNRAIRPVFSDVCFQCHGPAVPDRQADLRLDQSDAIRKSQDGKDLLVPGKPETSELFLRITSQDPTVRMPPPDAERQLSPQQIESIRQWISEGATWEPHWAFVPPRQSPLPEVASRDWPLRRMDSYILHRLEQEKLPPSQEASPESLLRRVTLDLTGLPPAPMDTDTFSSDQRPDAFDRHIDRLLSSPRVGERLAVEWLDASRYADTSGYQNDGPRSMWRWRDWIINAFNRGMGFDRFTVEQLAGDLLPNATLEQRIATGFNRNHRGNAEGGIIPEEYAVEYVVDRVETTMTVWQGLTVGCARCHDHKFDPVSQREFYQLFAFFNSIPEFGRAIKEGNSPPFVSAPTDDESKALHLLNEKLTAAERRVEELEPSLSSSLEQWAQSSRTQNLDDWTLKRDLVAHFAFDGNLIDQDSPQIAARPDHNDATFVPGQRGGAVDLKGGQYLSVDVGEFGYFDAFSFGAWVNARSIDRGTILSRMADMRRGDGYYLQWNDGHLQVNFVKRWLDDSLRLQTTCKLPPDKWHHIFVTYDGSRGPAGVRVYLDGEPVQLDVQLDLLNQSFATKEPFRIGAGGGSEGRFDGLLDDVRIYRRSLSANVVGMLNAEPLSKLLERSQQQRSKTDALKVREAYLERYAASEIRDAHQKLRDLRLERSALVGSFSSVMVMEELAIPRDAFILMRGQYDKIGEKVSRAVPACLPSLPAEAPTNRLGLARWLVDPSNPLTARVTANRFWQMLFGAGLVKTPEDFGSQGAAPVNPDLLDWLAIDFVNAASHSIGSSGADGTSLNGAWDVKRWIRNVVTSATYRQSSSVSATQMARDPENKLLGRSPRTRLSAEMIRDQALAASGLYVERLGGPSVRPYQPDDLWKELATDTNYVADPGAGLYRRSMYTYWKRTVSPPTMSTFDAGGRESCQVRRASTNTPLQSLALLNDITYVEAARALATRAIREGGELPAARLGLAFQLVIGRKPTQDELNVLERSLSYHETRFKGEPAAASALLEVGNSAVDSHLDPAKLAAYTSTVSLILNLDEAIMKQ